MLPNQKKVISEYYEVHFRFYLKNFKMTDEDNLVKTLQDCIVKKGIISDDRRIIKHVIEKFPSETDYIEYEILSAEIKRGQDER